MSSNRDRISDNVSSYRNKWTFEKKVQFGSLITLIILFFTLIGSIFTSGYQTAQQMGRITNLEGQVKSLVDASPNVLTQPIRIDNLEVRVQTVEKTLDLRAEYGQRYTARLDVLEARFNDFEKAINRIEMSVNKIVDREYAKK